MNLWKPTILALALAGAAPTQAQNADKELQELKARVAELERKAKAEGAKEQEQAQELARVSVKAEAMEDSRDAAGFKGLKISGYMDPVYLWNSNLQKANFQFLWPVQPDGAFGYTNSYFGTVQLDIQKEMDNGTKWRFTIMPQRSTGAVFGDLSIVSEATVSIPLGDLQTRLIAGQMPDWSGYEYLQATQNKLISHNLLFDYTLPTAYTGAGMDFFAGKWEIKWMLANMNASHRAYGEAIPALAYRFDYSGGGEFWGIGFAGVEGMAINYNSITDASGNAIGHRDSWVDLFEIDGWYTRGDLNLNGQIGVGRQKYGATYHGPNGDEFLDTFWAGVSVLAAYRFTPRLEGVIRGDFIYNEKNGGGLLGYPAADPVNGIGPEQAWVDDGSGALVQTSVNPDKGANRYAVTVGCSYAYNTNVTFKLEGRYDGATKNVFQKNSSDGTGKFVNNNFQAATSVVVSF